MSIEAMKQAQVTPEELKCLKDANPDIVEQPAQPVSELTDDEIYDAAHATFCRGPNTRELFRMMWTSNPPCSIGWDRNELKAFARHIASLYTTPQRPWVGLTDEEILDTLGISGSADADYNAVRTLNDARKLEAKLKEKNT